MTSDAPQEKPRIVIDEDWKEQVEREREELRRREHKGPAAPEEAGEAAFEQLPPASFAFLVTSLATQTLTALGQLADPISGKPTVRRELAQHHIDTLAMLEEKTKGNLMAEESQLLQDALHQLRMLYVHVTN
jgi:hypothetical protein